MILLVQRAAQHKRTYRVSQSVWLFLKRVLFSQGPDGKRPSRTVSISLTAFLRRVPTLALVSVGEIQRYGRMRGTAEKNLRIATTGLRAQSRPSGRAAGGGWVRMWAATKRALNVRGLFVCVK